MPSLYSQIEISAPKAIVWRTLLDKPHWLRWNTFLYDRNPLRPFAQGRSVQLSLKRLRAETETEFEPKILLLQPETCLRWSYRAPGFKSEHLFELQEVGRSRTQYFHRETLSGILSPVILAVLRQDEQQGMRRMARELKYYLED